MRVCGRRLGRIVAHPCQASPDGLGIRKSPEKYERRGTANVFCAVEQKAGRHYTFAPPDRSGFEFAKAVFELALCYPTARTIHLIPDNLNIHRRKSLTDLPGAEVGGEVWDRFTVHCTPTFHSKKRTPSLDFEKRRRLAWNYRLE